LTTAAASLSVGLPSAMAAPPSNDTVAGATAVSLGFSELLDTTEATTDADDAALGCIGPPAIDASVWYAYTAPVDGGVVDASSSSFPPGISIATGAPGSLTLESCAPFANTFAATAGTTYYIQAFDFSGDGVNGGLLSISIAAAAPPPTLDVKVDPTGFVDAKTGVATIKGTITCTDASFVDLQVNLTQPVGKRATVAGFGGFFSGGSICDGTPRPWSADIPPVGGRFVGGKSASVALTFACGTSQCALGFAEQTVKLNGGKR
jgi:hypothetical protein